ncbi:hypothetical protein BY996DRAFT_8204810 [Phakopsora pachyrhizi]|nr:hypothetical protein BY996DRAFT_8204810 [Phakopsora pachyrhizi]
MLRLTFLCPCCLSVFLSLLMSGLWRRYTYCTYTVYCIHPQSSQCNCFSVLKLWWATEIVGNFKKFYRLRSGACCIIIPTLSAIILEVVGGDLQKETVCTFWQESL